MSEKNKQKILIITDWFAPGFLAGGPIRSCVNFVENMTDHYEPFVFTSDRDLGTIAPYSDISANQWVTFGEKSEAQVYYASPGLRSITRLYRQIKSVKPDFVYLNSMFSFSFTQIPLLILWVTGYKGKIVLAPRGMLHSGALQFKALKKKLFLTLAKWSGLTNRIIFQATDDQESRDIKKWLNAGNITLLGNFPQSVQQALQSRKKRPGKLNMVFISRVSPKKNLLYLLEILKKVKGDIQLSIIGPMEDQSYVATCQQTIDQFPESHSVIFEGEVQHHDIEKRLNEFHFFVLPTYGENFGHAIFEAFLAGCPVIISDQTPWKNLERQHAGWEISLDHPEKFEHAITKAVEMDQAEYDLWSKGAWHLAKTFNETSTLKEEYQKLFS